LTFIVHCKRLPDQPVQVNSQLHEAGHTRLLNFQRVAYGIDAEQDDRTLSKLTQHAHTSKISCKKNNQVIRMQSGMPSVVLANTTAVVSVLITVSAQTFT
jgi:hypothetical protein